MKNLKERENFIMQGEEVMGARTDIVGGEENLIDSGLEDKTNDQLITMLVKIKNLNYDDVKELKREELIKKLTADM